VSHRIDVDPRDPHRYLATEWLLTNGLGGYAMGTVLGANMRRYHGLLVAAVRPPVERIVALHSIIEQLVMPREDGSEEVVDLSTQMFVGPDGEPMLHPQGWKCLRSFVCDTRQCTWTLEVAGVTIRRRLSLSREVENNCSIGYELEHAHGAVAARGVALRVRPLIALRDFHSLDHGERDFTIDAGTGALSIARGSASMRLESSARFEPDSQIWRRFAYLEDRRRGQDWSEDLWSPGEFVKQISAASGDSLQISATIPLASSSSPGPPHAAPLRENQDGLRASARQFIVSRDDSHGRRSASIIAGYPWFADWGRDAMISMPGLLLCTGRLDEARSLLHLFAAHMRRGLIPNCFDDRGGEPLYNTVDASLWFVDAVQQLRIASTATAAPAPGGAGTDASLLRACRDIIAAYRDGTEFNIRMDSRDGLIVAGDATTQLTWMDARRDGVVFTPRHGKAVEINALWFNALRCMAEMSDDSRERDELRKLSERVRESFVRQFWWSEWNCLHDVLVPVDADEDARGTGAFVPDGRLRPNQIFAVSLHHSMLDRAKQRAVVNIVRERLLTPFGLRTLDRDDPGYRGRYEGNMFERDAAYHNGTVWPWLIGPYCEAVLRVGDFRGESMAEARRAIDPLLREMDVQRPPFRGCLGQVAEVYDGDEPHRPDGCPAQAWSVAALARLRSMIERAPA
jgi:glycogen debranching enzyme